MITFQDILKGCFVRYSESVYTYFNSSRSFQFFKWKQLEKSVCQYTEEQVLVPLREASWLDWLLGVSDQEVAYTERLCLPLTSPQPCDLPYLL